MNFPETLSDICLEYLSSHLDHFKDVILSQELCEALVLTHTTAGRPVDASFGKLFADTKKTKLKKVSFRNGNVTAMGLSHILEHKLTNLDCSWCVRPPTSLLAQINAHGENLVELSVGSWKKIEHYPRGFENSPKLRKLEIYKWHDFGNSLTLPVLLKPLPELVSLNLCCALGVKSLTCLTSLTKLRRLYLHNVVKPNVGDMSANLITIRTLRNLTHLDISTGTEEMYKTPDEILASLVKDLPDLVYLDISGTNLAGRGVVGGVAEGDATNVARTDIIGLQSRVDKPLQFLGLYESRFNACRRSQIPAITITGDKNSEQLLNALRAYIDRPNMLQRILNEIYSLNREVEGRPPYELFEAVMSAMERHIKKKTVQIAGSASLFFVVKDRENQLPIKIRQRIIRVLVNGMRAHKEDQFLLRNCCLCLCQFKIPQDMMFDYERIIEILLFTTTEMIDATFVQRIAIYLLNSLACQVDGPHKNMLGEAGAVEKMLQLIEKRLQQSLCDDVMEVAWSTLWNVTDETAMNCQHFLDWDGMDRFCACLKAFPDKPELLRNMMGLLGNVAEVPSLRHRLMTGHYVEVFVKLLLSDSDGIEVSYNATGVLAHMCSDGPETWSLVLPARDIVLGKMRSAIDRWDLYAERNINYRSFEPILGLLKIDHTPECQHWAAWALANLTLVYPKRYCELVENEGGLDLLKIVSEKRTDYPKVPELCKMVIDNCTRFKFGNYQGANLEG